MGLLTASPPGPPLSIPSALAWAHPVVQEWFVGKFGTPTEPQEQGWPHILAGRTTLISAPTGSGKTLAAFLACIDQLVRKSIRGELCDTIEVLYVSPLKALGNDIQKNLEAPLSEIMRIASARGFLMPEIRTFVRTGDTLPVERARMLKRPPHILVTTPESLYILLTAEKSRQLLRTVQTVIVDEIHAIADDKRGAHLALSLARLDALVTEAHSHRMFGARRPLRIGLSATQKPIELVAEFLTGCHPHQESTLDPVIVNVGHRRTMDIAVEVPGIELGPIATHDMWNEVYERLVVLINTHRSTLIFVNTRSMAERIAHNLGERIGEELVASHHGSLARKLRLKAETKLKNGEVKALVATASLELGIDIGFVDLVCHISSPRSISGMVQRIGRAGHWRGAIPKGRIFAMTRDQLVECAALVRAIRSGELDRLYIPDAPMDILAQHVVAMCSAEPEHGLLEDDLFTLARRAFPYRHLERKHFDDIIVMLSEGIVSSRGKYGAYLLRDRVNGRVKARRGSRLIAVTNGGAIPDTNMYTMVVEPEGIVLGTLDEDFAVDSSAGDVLLLGNSSWRIRRIESAGRVLVEDAHGAPPTVPFWLGEAPARTQELSAQIAEVHQRVSDFTINTAPGYFAESAPEVQNAVAWLKEECGLDDSGAQQIVEYIISGRAVLGAVPTQQTLIAERFFDEGGGMQLIIHAPFGGRINKAWGLALRKRFCRSFNFELQAAATDNGLNISLAEQHSFPLADVFHFLHENTVEHVLEQASFGSPIFGSRWRWDAGRALALLRYRNGKKIPPQVQRIRSDDLLASVFPDVSACPENLVEEIRIPDHPLVREVMKDILTEAMDIEGLKSLIRGITDGSIRCIAVDTPVPSQFSHEILNANPYAYLDDAPLEERRARAVGMRRALPDSVLEEVGKLDPAAIASVREEAWPDVRDADELHDVLQTLVALPESLPLLGRPAPASTWGRFFEHLSANHRATRALVGGQPFWVCAEKATVFAVLYPDAPLEQSLPEINFGAEAAPPSYSDAVLSMTTGWMMHCGPVTAASLGGALQVPAPEIEKALLRMEGTGSILRGKFDFLLARQPLSDDDGRSLSTHDASLRNMQWCERRLLARIHRLTLSTLRKQIEPVTSGLFMNWLLRWQHVAPQSQLAGERGVLEALRQLQGFELPAIAWEREILARRVTNYDPKHLDQLCLTGAVGWGRLSPHPATLESVPTGRRIVPTSVAPITFYLRDDCDWMTSKHELEVNALASRGMGSRSSANGASANGAAVNGVESNGVENNVEANLQRTLSPVGQEVRAFLQSRGASFFPDVVRGTGKPKAEVETGLWELVAAGLVTADGFQNLRALIQPRSPRNQNPLGRVSRVAPASRPRNTAGRWSLLYAGGGVERAKALEATCWMLLNRYGIVFRELLTRETVLPKWRELLVTFRRLEDRGEIRGGRFIQGFVGEQFALPQAVESLRALRNVKSGAEVIAVSAADPLNLVGILLPGDRVPALSGKTVNYCDGVPVGTPVEAAEAPQPPYAEAKTHALAGSA